MTISEMVGLLPELDVDISESPQDFFILVLDTKLNKGYKVNIEKLLRSKEK